MDLQDANLINDGEIIIGVETRFKQMRYLLPKLYKPCVIHHLIPKKLEI